MAESQDPSRPRAPEEVAAELARLMPRDAVYTLRFLGESQHRLRAHFEEVIARELAGRGVTAESHPMIRGFIETHALLLRDFVLSGVAMTHQLRLGEIERLLGDTTSVLSVDIWDDLRGHIETAERQFRAQADALPDQLEGYRAP
ncbi:hypothetical protein [Amaricoccus solimangrovi]|uniref:hypothetical protein n=1 Tax=Amaricoccus solimangrovi TaxID=2589815 RepID=UPI001AEE57D0|nr:hypothetical protein [Amaricoccus solimangrovi]